MAAVDQPVEEGRGHPLIPKHLRPMGKVEIRSQGDAGALVPVREELEEQFGRRLREGQVAQLVDQDEGVAAILREQLGQEGEQSAAYRQGLTLPFAKVAALALTLLGEMARSPAGPETVRLGGLT